MRKEYDKLSAEIRLIDSKIENLSYERNNYGNMIFIADSMLKKQPLLLLIGTCAGFLYGGISNMSQFFVSALNSGLSCFLMSLITVLIMTGYFSVSKMIYINKFKKIETEILTSEDLKHEYERELVKIKENIKKPEHTKKGTIYFEDKQNLVNEVILVREIEKVDKSKKLTLKKKK